MKLNGSEIIMECLLEQGVDTVFGYPGGAVLNIYDALYKYSDKIRHILTAHEQGAAHAADGYARATGKPSVVIATSGPGATNLVTGLATAYMDSVPVIAITGNVATDLLGRDSFQEIDITGITMPITKHNYIVKDIEALADTIRSAFKIATTGRKGPVLIDIPKDISAKVCEYTYKKAECTGNSRHDSDIDENKINKLAEMILNSDRPMIYAGGGVISSGAWDELRSLAETNSIPVSQSIMGLSCFPASSPLNMGMIGMHGSIASNKASVECDLMIVAGARFSDRVAGDRTHFAPNAKLIHIDIDEAEFNKNVSCNMYLKGDMKLILRKLNSAIQALGISSPPRKNWLEKISEWKELDKLTPIKMLQDKDYVNPYLVIKSLHDYCPDAYVATDVGQHQMWTTQYFGFEKPQHLITSGGLGTMGFGLGAAIGAQVGEPDSRVILVTSDGSFHMNMNELTTVSSYNLPIVIVLMNNQVLGMVRQWQKAFYGNRFSQTSPNRHTNFENLAKAFGINYIKISKNDEIEAAVKSAFDMNAPILIDCRISPDVNVLPMIPPGKSAEDIMLEM